MITEVAADMSYPTLEQHLDPNHQPKRILALDGGGVRGIVTLAYLQEIENILRQRREGDPDFRLCHYFDLIGGTSTGAIIASALARGMSVAEVIRLYEELAARVFKRSWFRQGLARAKFSRTALDAALKDALGEETRLRDRSLKTGLMIMTKRIDTSSTWPLHNNPAGKYFACPPDQNWIANSDFLLWKVVRASTAAPHFFDPEALEVDWQGDQTARGYFVDGGVSTANNPALQLLMFATLSGYRLRWPMGEDNILLVSVGTGLGSSDRSHVGLRGRLAAGHALNSLLSIMDDCNALVETLLQWMSTSPTARRIDGEVEDLSGDLVAGRPLLTYLRYNLLLENRWLSENLGVKLAPKQLTRLAEMDAPKNMPALKELAGKAASRQIHSGHFPPSFDVARDRPH